MSKRTHLGVRAAALTCSIALVGAYLVYRSGDLLMPSTKSGRVVGPDDDAREVLLPGSKSNNLDLDGTNVLYGDGSVELPSTNPFERAVLPGSKVMAPLIRSGEPPATQSVSESEPRP